MQSGIKRLPAAAEFVVVIGLAFGYFVWHSLHIYFFGHWHAGGTNAGKLNLVCVELVLFALAGSFMWARGWTPERLGLAVSLRDTLIGLGMGLALYLVNRGILLAVWQVPELRWIFHVPRIDAEISLASIVLLLAVNSVFEEVFAAGYLLTFLKERFGAALAVNAGLFLRVLYHLYQGVGAVLHIVPMSLMFGIWYVRTRRLWPLIVAHATAGAIGYLHLW